MSFTQIQLRTGSAAQWTAANPVLGLAEPAVESDTLKVKIGDGSTSWTSLAYLAGGGGSGSVTGVTAADSTLTVVTTLGAVTVKIANNVTLPGTPAAATASVDTNTGQLATCSFVLGQAASATPIVNGTGAVGTSTRYARADHVHPSDTSRAAVTENVNVVATSGSSQTLPANTSDTMHRVTLTAPCTLTFPSAGAGKSFTLQLVQNGTGGYAITWPGSNLVWVAGTAPTLATGANKRNLLSFVCLDGTNWEGVAVSSSSGY